MTNQKDIEARFDERFCSTTSIPKYSVWKAEALAYPKEVKQFLFDEIERVVGEVEKEKVLFRKQEIKDLDNARKEERQRALDIIEKYFPEVGEQKLVKSLVPEGTDILRILQIYEDIKNEE